MPRKQWQQMATQHMERRDNTQHNTTQHSKTTGTSQLPTPYGQFCRPCTRILSFSPGLKPNRGCNCGTNFSFVRRRQLLSWGNLLPRTEANTEADGQPKTQTAHATVPHNSRLQVSTAATSQPQKNGPDHRIGITDSVRMRHIASSRQKNKKTRSQMPQVDHANITSQQANTQADTDHARVGAIYLLRRSRLQGRKTLAEPLSLSLSLLHNHVRSMSSSSSSSSPGPAPASIARLILRHMLVFHGSSFEICPRCIVNIISSEGEQHGGN